MREHRAGNLAEADRLYGAILKRNPRDAEAWNLRGVLAAQAGRPDAGIDHIGRAIRIDDRNPVFHYNLALAYQAARNGDAAITSYRRATLLKPDYVDALINLGNLLFNKGDLGEAADSYRKAAQLAPTSALAQHNLGSSLLTQESWEEAAACFREALRLKPDFADAHNGLGATYLGLEQYSEATASLNAALRYEPRHARAHNNLGLARARQGQFQEAIASFLAALRINPTYLEARQNLGKMYLEMEWFDEAEASYREALRIKPAYLNARIGLARVLEEREDFAAAFDIFSEILEMRPDYEPALLGKVRALEFTGQIDEAHAIVRRLSNSGTISPEAAAAFADTANTYHQMRDNSVSPSDAIAVLENVLEKSTLAFEGRRGLHFGLGSLYDKLDKFDEAFCHFQKGNALRPTPFELDDFEARIGQMIANFTPEHLARLPRATNLSELPVFIVGMARSGTSLVEQILDCHPDVFGAGELKDIAGIRTSLISAADSDGSGADFLSGVDQETYDMVAGRHLERLNELGGGVKRITDKMPDNFLRLGFISLLFPGARVIHCRRDPMDICLSCYFQNFSVGNFHAFDLGDIGGYYVQYDRLMRHWHNVLDIPMLEVRYEEHVAEPEKTCREMLDFLDLEWDPRCLQFHESERIAKTASRKQVREPIYTRSVARWRNYEHHLGPLKEALAEIL